MQKLCRLPQVASCTPQFAVRNMGSLQAGNPRLNACAADRECAPDHEHRSSRTAERKQWLVYDAGQASRRTGVTQIRLATK
jgi:hypothetical protein